MAKQPLEVLEEEIGARIAYPVGGMDLPDAILGAAEGLRS
jgi:hypothetical protein